MSSEMVWGVRTRRTLLQSTVFHQAERDPAPPRRPHPSPHRVQTAWLAAQPGVWGLNPDTGRAFSAPPFSLEASLSAAYCDYCCVLCACPRAARYAQPRRTRTGATAGQCECPVCCVWPPGAAHEVPRGPSRVVGRECFGAARRRPPAILRTTNQNHTEYMYSSEKWSCDFEPLKVCARRSQLSAHTAPAALPPLFSLWPSPLSRLARAHEPPTLSPGVPARHVGSAPGRHGNGKRITPGQVLWRART